jgi:hypothetical protein
MNPSESAARSEALLPAEPDPQREVAEEVSLDQQSDAARQVGAVKQGPAAQAMAEALKPDPGPDSGGRPLNDALERAVPPSV